MHLTHVSYVSFACFVSSSYNIRKAITNMEHVHVNDLDICFAKQPIAMHKNLRKLYSTGGEFVLLVTVILYRAALR